VIEMRARTSCIFLLVASCMLLCCCVATQQNKPALIRQAEKLNASGMTATEQRRYLAAERDFAEAYKAFSRVEDYRGMATVLINSSRMYRGQGLPDKAALMAEPAVSLTEHVPELRAEAWFEMAKISLLRQDTAGALNWAEKSLTLAEDGNRAQILSLLADIHLKKGALQKGAELAEDARTRARSSGDRHEEADALRILADIRLARQEYGAAAGAYSAALALDKELAEPRSIYADLKGLALVSQQQGDDTAAAGFLLRAADVAAAEGDLQRATADLESLLFLKRTDDASARTAGVAADRLERLKKKVTGGAFHGRE